MSRADGTKPLWLSLIAISSVVLVEGLAGLLVNSLALLGDAAHASFDVVATFLLLLMTRWSLKPPDESHTYGHEKVESLGGLMGGFILLVLAIVIANESLVRILGGGIPIHPGTLGFGAIVYTLSVDIFRIGVLKNAGGSATGKAGFFHAISDFSSTIVALIGVTAASYGYYLGDAAASLMLSGFLCYISGKLIYETAFELSDAVPRTVLRKVEREIARTKGVTGYKSLKVRKAGKKTYVRVTVNTPEYVELEEAHSIASRVESNINRVVSGAEVTVHIEPLIGEPPFELRVRRIALEADGVREAHNIEFMNTQRGLCLSLHLGVDPKMPLEEAHHATEQIEKRLRAEFSELADVTVHLEPIENESIVGRRFEDITISEAVTKIVGSHKEIIRVGKIMLYKAGTSLHIDVSCSFEKDVPLDLAHSIVTSIEQELMERFEKAKVTIHQEPYSGS